MLSQFLNAERIVVEFYTISIVCHNNHLFLDC